MFEDTVVEGVRSPKRSQSPTRVRLASDTPEPPAPFQLDDTDGEPDPGPETPDPRALLPPANKREEADLHSEFLYYTSLFKPLSGALTKASDKANVFPWVTKLFGPEYHADPFREKRNRYLCSLCLSLMNDELTGVFKNHPPEGALPHWIDIEVDEFPPASWEQDTMWDETMAGIGGRNGVGQMSCNFHDDTTDPCPNVGPVTSKMMDDEFAFYLHLCRPYAAMMPSADEKTKVAVWLHALQMISREACPTMKGLRNDYIQALLGCVCDLRTAGPFLDYPPATRLYPLTDAAKLAALTHPGSIDPTSREADMFMSEMSVPDEGAFCYIAVSGELEDSSLPELMKANQRAKTPPRTSLSLALKNVKAPSVSKPKANASKPNYEVEEIYKKGKKSATL